MTTMRDVALELAAKGLHVFRLQPNSKLPPEGSDHHTDNPNGWNTPSCDAEVVYRRWTDAKTGASLNDNVGIDTTHGLCVFDIDTKDGRSGQNDWKRCLNELGDMPVTYGVSTPSGGIHFYTRVPEAVSGRMAFGKGIDIRSHHGYVVGAGSRINGKVYTELPYSDDIVDLPAPWLARTTAPAARAASQEALVELDTPDAILAAVGLLTAMEAPSEGDRDNATFRAVCQVKDLGVSEGYCLDLILQHFNNRTRPPMSLALVRAKVSSAYRGNSQNAPGIASPEHQFGDIDLSGAWEVDTPPKPSVPAVVKGRMVSFDASLDPAALPPRPWVIRDTLLRQDLTVVVAPGAAGKSTLTILWALALVTGRGDIIGDPKAIKGKHRVGLINREDRRDEVYRRIYAACDIHGIDRNELTDTLFLYEGPSITMAARKGQMPMRTIHVQMLKDFARDSRLDVMMVDPFVATHRLIENDNGDMDMVARLYIEIAEEMNLALGIVHHASKPGQTSSEGHASSQHSARGASAIVNAARIVINFFPMSDNDAKQNGVPPTQKFRYVRLDGPKRNFSLGDGEPDWYERVSVQLPNGDHVGALRRIDFETARNSEARVYTTAIIANWGELDYAGDEGVDLKDCVEAIKADPMLADKTVEDITKTLRRVFKEGQTDGRYTVWVHNTGTEKRYKWRVSISEEDVDE